MVRSNAGRELRGVVRLLPPLEDDVGEDVPRGAELAPLALFGLGHGDDACLGERRGSPSLHPVEGHAVEALDDLLRVRVL
jgi:hypothetical protein